MTAKSKQQKVEAEASLTNTISDWYNDLAVINEMEFPGNRHKALRDLHSKVETFHETQKKHCERLEKELKKFKKEREKIEKESDRISGILEKAHNKDEGVTRERTAAILLKKGEYLKREIDENTKAFSKIITEVGKREDSLEICTHAAMASSKVLHVIDKSRASTFREIAKLNEIQVLKPVKKGTSGVKVPKYRRTGRTKIP